MLKWVTTKFHQLREKRKEKHLRKRHGDWWYRWHLKLKYG